MESPTANASTSCKNSNLYEEVNVLLAEYLELNGMEKTLSSFKTECQTHSLPCSSFTNNNTDDTDLKAAFTRYDYQNLLNAFNTGDLETFMELWNTFQAHIQVTSDDMKKLEVYLRVHFALWPKINDESEEMQAKALNELKIYFEKQSNNLSNDQTLLPLFALPFVSDPSTHPIFRDLFQPQWTHKLLAQLEATMRKYFDLLQENICTHSKLAALVENSKNENGLTKSEVNNLPVSYYHDRFFQLVTTYRKMRKLLRGTRESYGKLLKVANELTVGLEQSLAGSSISLPQILEQCCDIFPQLFIPQNAAKAKPDMEYFKTLATKATFDQMLDCDVSLLFIGISDMSPESLNFAKIKTVLASDATTQSDKLCLLQSLRWLLTKSTAKYRKIVLDAFIEGDILGLTSKSSNEREKIFICMLSPTPTYLKECFARFLNALASKNGRAYIASSNYSLDILVKSLQTFKGSTESYICQMAVACLQKLSLRKLMRLGMIDRKVIQWLVVYLKSELAKKEAVEKSATSVPLQDEFIEYGWALLMNLCLHEESKGPSSAMGPDILTCVIQMLLSKPSREVAPYVISTLYSLLRNPDIFAMAQRMGLQDTFATVITKQDNSDVSTHLTHLIALLNFKGYDRLQTSGEVDYNDSDSEDPEEYEPEIEVTETWCKALSENCLVGDDLLLREYMKHIEDTVPTLSKQKAIDNLLLLNRPTTPLSKGRTASAEDNNKLNPEDNNIKKSRSRKSRSSSISKSAANTKETELDTTNNNNIMSLEGAPTIKIDEEETISKSKSRSGKPPLRRSKSKSGSPVNYCNIGLSSIAINSLPPVSIANCKRHSTSDASTNTLLSNSFSSATSTIIKFNKLRSCFSLEKPLNTVRPLRTKSSSPYSLSPVNNRPYKSSEFFQFKQLNNQPIPKLTKQNANVDNEGETNGQESLYADADELYNLVKNNTDEREIITKSMICEKEDHEKQK